MASGMVSNSLSKGSVFLFLCVSLITDLNGLCANIHAEIHAEHAALHFRIRLYQVTLVYLN